MVYSPRIGPDGAFVREIKEIKQRISSFETRPAGQIVIRETLTTEDPVTGVKTVIGQLPDGTNGIQPFVGDVTPPPVATTPVATAQPGIITVTWDGLFVNNEEKPRDFEHVNVIGHKLINGVISSSLTVGVIRLSTDTVLVTQDIAAIGETWQFSLESEDYNGNKAARSTKSPVITMLSAATDEGVNAALDQVNQQVISAQNAAASAQDSADNAQKAADDAAQAVVDLGDIKGAIYTQSATPSADPNGLWIDTGHNNVPRRYLGKTGTALVSNLGGGASIATRLTALGWSVSAITVTPTFAQASGYDVVAFDAGYAGLSSSIDTLAQQLLARGVSIYTSGNDTTSLPYLFTGSGSRGATKNPIRPYGTHPAAQGWTQYSDADLNFYLTGVNSAATITGVTLVGTTDQPLNIVRENDKSFARWVHIETYATPSAVIDAHLNWLADNWVAIQDQGIVDASNAAGAAQNKADQAFNNAATAATAAGNAQTTADGKNRVWYQTSAPAGTGNKVGDTWFDTDDGYKIYVWDGSAWKNSQDAGIAAAQNTANTKTKTYFQTTQPALSGNTVGDIWFDTSNGNKPFVWNGTVWSSAQDAAIGTAQSTANNALTSANGKNKVYYQNSMPTGGTYINGDTWFDTSNGNKIYVYNGSTFVSAQDAAIGTAQNTANSALSTANTKTKTYFQTASPALTGNTVGDSWFDSDDGNKPYVWNGSAWVNAQDATIAAAQSTANTALTSANGKNTTYYQTAQPSGGTYIKGDTWFDTDDGNKIYVYNGSAWIASQDATIATAQGTANNALSTANSKTKTYFQTTQPAVTGNTTGDIWFDTGNGNKTYVWNGSAWTSAQDTAIAAAQSSANGKNRIYYQTAQPTGGTYIAGDTWFDTDDGNKIYVYSGSAWVNAQDASIATAQSTANSATTAANNAQTTANAKTTTFNQSTAPSTTGRTVGDIWFDTSNGNKPMIWSGSAWVSAQDASIASAQSTANSALTSANGKNRIYYQTAQPSGGTYISGDTWFDTDDGNKIYVYNGSTWVASQDASIATAQTAANNANTAAGNAQTTANSALSTANSKTKTYFQSTSPSTSGNTTGDIWFDTGNGNKTYVWNGSAWANAQDTAIAAAQTSANGKNRIYYQTAQPTGGTYIAGDTWFDTDDGNKIYVYSGSAWVNAQDASIAAAQTTATNAQTAANTAQTSANTAQTTANAKTTTFTQATAPSTSGRTTGDIWFDTSNGNKPMVWNGSAWVSAQDAAIASAQTTANNALTSANGKNKTYYQTAQPSGGTYITGDTWFDTDDGYKIYVYNGSAWVASQDASIATAQTTANNANTAAGNAQTTANNALTTANSKTKTYFQTTQPSATGNTTGDIWFDTGNGNKTYVWNGTAWTNAQDAAITAAQTSANGKNTIFYQTTAPSTTGRVTGDTWFDTANGYKIYVWNGSAWTASQDTAIATAQSAANTAQTTANSKTKTFIQGTAPTATTVGDIWIDTANGNVIKTWEGSSWVTRADAAIAAAQSAANAAQTTAGGKNTIISAASAPATAGHINGDIWFDTSNGNKPMIFSTNAWVSAQDASIATAQSAANTAQTTANGKNTVTYSTAVASGSGTRAGDVWFQTSAGVIIGQWQWSGTAWVQQTIDNAVIANLDAGKINVGTLNAARIGAGTITSTMIATDTITAGNIAAGAVTASELSAGSVQAQHLTASAISATAIAADAITARELAAGSITAAKGQISDLAVTTAKIADTAITNAKIGNLAVGTAQIQDTAITNAKIANLDAGKITTGTLDANRIGADTITATHIASDAITSNELAANSITAAKGQISDAAITTAKIGDAQITNAKIADLAVTNAKIADATIASAKIAQLDAGKITTGTLDANRIGANTISTGKLMVGDFTNLFPSPQFAASTGGVSALSNAVAYSGAEVPPIGLAANLGARDHVGADKIAVRPGDQFYMEFSAKSIAGSAAFNAGIWVTTASNGASAGWSQWSGLNGGMTKIADLPNGWARYRSKPYVDASWGGVSYAQIYFQISQFSPYTTNWLVADIEWRRRASGNLLVDGAITAGSAIIGTGAIGSAQIADLAVGTAEIQDTAITSAKIANLAVGTAQIQDTAITNAKIGNLAVGTAQIQDTAITNAKIANLDAGKITTGTLDANRIGADTITATHIASDAITANELAANSITAAKGQISALAVGTAQIQDTAITNAKIGNLAVGTAQIQDTAITNAKIANLDAGKITTGTLDANRIGANTISASKLMLGDFENLATINEVNNITVSSYGQTQVSAGYNTQVNDSNTFLMFRDRTGPVPFKNTERLYFSFTAKANVTTTVQFGIWIYNAAGSNKTATSSNLTINTTDTAITGSLVVPATDATFGPAKEYVLGLNNVANKGIGVKDVVVRRMNGGELLVDGTITAGSAIIATGAIGSAQIANLAVGTAQIADTAITNAKIGNLAVSTAQIQDTAITNAKIANLDAAKITTGTLDANRIGADSITATHIASDAITANELAANSITAAKGQIADLAITTAKIQDTAITNAKIANLDAAKITTGTLDANRIGANTVTAEKIAVGDFTNLVDNGTFESDFLGWTNLGATTTTVSAYSGTKSAQFTGSNSAVQIRGIAVTPGDKLWVSIYYRTTADKAGAGGLRIRDQNGGEGVTWSGGYDVGVNTSWTQLTGVATVNAGVTTIYPRLAFALSAGTVWLDNFVIRRQTGAVLIENGAIQAGSGIIGNLAVGTAQIADTAITTAKIANLAVDTAQIKDTAITNAKIANLDAAKITTGTLDANRIGANTITATKLNVTLGGNNLCANSSFEADSNNDGLADNWMTWTRGAGDASRTFANTRPAGLFPGSTYAQRVTSNNVSNTEQSSIQATTLLSIAPSAVATISLYARASVAGTFSVSLRCEDDTAAYKGDAAVNFAFSTTTQRFVGTVTTPAGTTRAKVTITTPASITSGHWFEVDGIMVELGDMASAWSPLATELLPGTINATMIAANTITANSAIIATGAIGSAQIADLGVGTAEIADLAVKTAKIDDLAITNAKIANATIQAAKIGSVDAGTITAGFLSAARINSKSITTDKLVVSSTNNLIVEADFSNGGASWGVLNANKLITASSGRNGLPSLRVTGTTATQTITNLINKIPVGTEDRFRGSFYMNSSAAAASGAVKLYMKAYSTATSSVPVLVATSQAVSANTWTLVEGYSAPFPTGVTSVEFYLEVTNAATATTLDIDYVAVTRAADARLVVDGAIDGKTITGAVIQTASPALSGARIVLDSTGLRGWDSNNKQYISAAANGLAVTGSLGATGDGVDYSIYNNGIFGSRPVYVGIGGAAGAVGLGTGGQTWPYPSPYKTGTPIPGIIFKPTTVDMYDVASINARDGVIMSIQSGVTQADFDAWANQTDANGALVNARKTYNVTQMTLNANGVNFSKYVEAPEYRIGGTSLSTASVITYTGGGTINNQTVTKLNGLTRRDDASTDTFLFTVAANGYDLVARDTGVYDVFVQFAIGGPATGRSFVEVGSNADTYGGARGFFGASEDTQSVTYSGIRMTAGQTFSAQAFVTLGSGSINCGYTIRVTKKAAPLPVKAWGEGDITQTGNVTVQGDMLVKPRFAQFYNNGFQVASGSASWDTGPVTEDTSKSVNNNFAAPGPYAGSVKFTQSGWYQISLMMIPQSGNPMDSWMRIFLGSTGENLVQDGNRPASEIYLSTIPIYISANDYVRSTVVSPGGFTCNSVWKIVKFPWST